MGKTRYLFKKIRDTKGTFHEKMGTKEQKQYGHNRSRWQEYTEVYTEEKDLHDPDDHNGVITHLEPGILVCKVKWAVGSITMNKASGSNGIPGELFQILEDDAAKVLPSICQQI